MSPQAEALSPRVCPHCAKAIEDDRLLTEDELVKRWRGKVKIKTIANWRSNGEGPRFIKMGAASLYPLYEVEAWEKGRVVSTNRQHRGRT